MRFPTEDPMVLDFAVAPSQHIVTQAETIDPVTFVNVIALINAMGVAMAQEPLLVLFWATACIRRFHLCKSVVTGSDEAFL